MATLIKTDGTQTEVRPMDGKAFRLQELQGFVGSYIEAVYLPDGRVMWVNEEGKLEGLSYNLAATRLAGPALQPHDVIAGDALVMTMAEAGEEND